MESAGKSHKHSGGWQLSSWNPDKNSSTTPPQPPPSFSASSFFFFFFFLPPPSLSEWWLAALEHIPPRSADKYIISACVTASFGSWGISVNCSVRHCAGNGTVCVCEHRPLCKSVLQFALMGNFDHADNPNPIIHQQTGETSPPLFPLFSGLTGWCTADPL